VSICRHSVQGAVAASPLDSSAHISGAGTGEQRSGESAPNAHGCGEAPQLAADCATRACPCVGVDPTATSRPPNSVHCGCCDRRRPFVADPAELQPRPSSSASCTRVLYAWIGHTRRGPHSASLAQWALVGRSFGQSMRPPPICCFVWLVALHACTSRRVSSCHRVTEFPPRHRVPAPGKYATPPTACVWARRC